MKRLYLLRHAKAMNSEGGGDIERKLAPKGTQDALALGALMKSKDYQPTSIYCSPALRTKETLEAVIEGIGETKTQFEDKIYNSSRGNLFHLIQSADNACDALMIVAHNPGIHELAAMLAAEDDNGLINRLMSEFSPGTLCVFDCPKAAWSDIQPAENMIVDFLSPSDYNDPARPTRWM